MPEYRSWAHIIQRTTNPSDAAFGDYGGRGIGVCDAWRFGEGGKTGFECFLDHVGRRPSPQHSIDRIENDHGYEPGNVRWATKSEQAKNRRVARIGLRADNRAGVKGVQLALSGKWSARITFNGRRQFLGAFDSKIEAGSAYQEAYVALRGQASP